MTEGSPDVDFDLHGFVGIRLVDPRPLEVEVVERQLGPLQARLKRAPDITIRFVDRLTTSGSLRLIGHLDAGYTDTEFVILRGRHKARVRVAIPLDQVGRGCQIVCERGVPAVPMLIPLVNMVALAHGAVPLHASAFVFEGIGVLATGWAKGGKTEMLLSFMSQGASYVGDEWIYLTPDGRMRGIPEPIRFWSWHLAELPAFRSRLTRADRLRLSALDRAARGSDWLGTRGPKRPSRAARQMAPLLRNQAYVQIPPRRMFGTDHCLAEARLDRLVMVSSHDDPRITIERITGAEVARRMFASNEHERLDFTAAYLKHRYAFPDRRSQFIETAAALEQDRLLQVMEECPAWIVSHPYPVSIPELFPAIWPAIEAHDRGSQHPA